MEMLSEKTAIYVTHRLEFLDASDLVLVMKDGKIIQSGKYEDLIQDQNGELVSQMTAHKKSLSQVNSNDSTNKTVPRVPKIPNRRTIPLSNSIRSRSFRRLL